MNEIFISYRREDSADVCGRIYDWLVSYFGKDKVFKDVDTIPGAANFRDFLNSTLNQCKFMVVIIGPKWSIR